MQTTETALAVAQPSLAEQEHSRRQRRRNNEEVSMGTVFGSSRPAHFGTGLMSGGWKVVQGVGLGVGALVAAPIVGARDGGGFAGFCKGAAAGVVGAVAFPIAGAVAGVSTICEGAMNTPEAFSERSKGNVYDSKTGTYVPKYYVLDELLRDRRAELQQAKETPTDSPSVDSPEPTTTGEDAETRPSRKVVDSEYYDTLGVEASATQGQIRKAYYKLAMDCHPDKHTDDPAAKEKFQKIGEAYQVLGDAARRDQYDRHGKAATEKMDFVDSSLMFSMLFGTDDLKPYVGKLRLMEMLDAEEMGDVNTQLTDLEQKVREVELAAQLRDRLQPYVEARKQMNPGNVGTWRMGMRQEAQRLAKQSFGSAMVDAVGFEYENYSEQWQGRKRIFFGDQKAKFNHQKRQMNVLMEVVKSAHVAASTSRKLKKKQEKRALQRKKDGEEDSPDKSAGDMDEMTQEDIEALDKSLIHIIKIMQNMCERDIAFTVRAASKLCINDLGVEEQVRTWRAEGLKELGTCFQEVAREFVPEEEVSVRDHIQEAYVKAAQKMDEDHHGPA